MNVLMQSLLTIWAIANVYILAKKTNFIRNRPTHPNRVVGGRVLVEQSRSS